jgi:lysophospholipase L1-like esterase
MPIPTESVQPGVTVQPAPYPRTYSYRTAAKGVDANLASQWQGKKLLSFGDSIMYGAGASGHGPSVQFAQKYGMSLTDYSRSGAFMTSRRVSRSTLLIIHQVERAIQEGAKGDLIILQGGCNDIYAGMTLGEVETDGIVGFDSATYAGAVEYCVTKLRAAYPDAVIMLLRPHNIGVLSQKRQQEVGEVLRQTCEKWGLIYADVFGDMADGAVGSPAELSDHPNRSEYGKYYIASMEAALRQPVPKGWAEP